VGVDGVTGHTIPVMDRPTLVAVALGCTLAVPPEAAARGDAPERLTFTLSERLRYESFDWFEPRLPDGEERARYDFGAAQTRVGVRYTLPRLTLAVTVQDTRLFGLPDDASLGPPTGALGPGAVYFAHERDRDPGDSFVKLANATWRPAPDGPFELTLGRFELADGLETVAADPTLAWLERARLGERLVGPFNYTHVTRSFDGLRAAWDLPAWHLSAFATRPTHGGFELDANSTIDDVLLAGASITWRGLPEATPTDLRFFGLRYEDDRGLGKVDNRPNPLRSADRGSIEVDTAGGHAATALPTTAGTADLMLWGVGQRGEWGALDHRAWAFAAEGGHRFDEAPWKPWLRAGWNRSSGDDAPGDGRHETFFQLLPTARVYAQFPFYNLMNLDDRFVQLLLAPHPRVTLRADLHRLELSAGRDLWYGGGGATSDAVFGFSGIATGGEEELAQVVELGLQAQLPARFSLAAYAGRAAGGDAVRAAFRRGDARFAFLELSWRLELPLR
jgi:hypothetical protein